MFDEGLALANEDGQDLVAINDALARVHERESPVIELRFFGGLSVEETAIAAKVSPDTVTRDWRLAKTMQLREMRRERESLRQVCCFAHLARQPLRILVGRAIPSGRAW
jgi:DNA-directed RNA polymerase specialized sigma24 family protein